MVHATINALIMLPIFLHIKNTIIIHSIRETNVMKDVLRNIMNLMKLKRQIINNASNVFLVVAIVRRINLKSVHNALQYVTFSKGHVC